MAQTILSSASSAPVFIAKDESTSQQVWSGIGVVDVETVSFASLTDMPLSNQQLTDTAVSNSIVSTDVANAKIALPSRMRVVSMVSDISIIESILSKFNDPTVTLSVQSKSLLLASMVLSEVEIEQSFDCISAAKTTLTLEQVQPSVSTGFAPEQGADTSIYSVSIATPTDTTGLGTLSKAISSATVQAENAVSNALRDASGNVFILDVSELS